ncbi:long-chain fatty acid--CoA ligase [Gordonia sp. TBRC 11910]|uniref:Long-chain fatty acid--CoA ligase n=1 Tax=Gordonia asplenii TaxID=2725283 RepID=A0A848L2Z9_9ACTN|nr:AMP-binding protein [Gordonia asplenii]NMO05146.1 long-chain fatty acid--CoA ligase [Gordonia asplenii]
MDVTTLMRKAAVFNADRPAIIAEDRTVTFAQSWDRGVRLANALIGLCVEPGDRVAALEDNILACADLYLACAIAGAVRVPLYARNSREAHQHMLDGTSCTVVLTDAAYADSVAGLESDVESLRHVIVRDSGYENWLAEQSPVDPMISRADDDWYIIRHSGGTTGRAKGAGFTHYDWVKNGRNWAYLLDRMTADSVVGHAGPISHASGYLFLPIWLAGGANVLFGAFDPQRVLRMMRTHRVSHMFASPALLAALARHPESSSAPWPHLRSILVGGSPITDATAQHAREVFGDTLYQAFGQTEAVPLTGMGPDEWFGDYPGSTPARSAGRVLPFAQVEIRDENDRPLPIGESGEIVAKVEGQMHGYWNEPELTATRLIDGWIHTRDIGRLDSNGFLYVLDRAEDMIVSGGFNIWPAELETVIADLPDVLEVAVFGIPHEKWGETPMAVVAVDAESTLSEQQVIDACRDRLGSYKKPTRVQVTTDPLPKSVVGKLLRRTLREPYWSGRDRHVQGV